MVVALGSLLTWLWQGTAVALGAAVRTHEQPLQRVLDARV